MIKNLNISLMPKGNRQYYLGRDCGDYGDIIIWIGRLYISWNWNLFLSKCELCGRSQQLKEITFDNNTFNACNACRKYLSTPYTIDVQPLIGE